MVKLFELNLNYTVFVLFVRSNRMRRTIQNKLYDDDVLDDTVVVFNTAVFCLLFQAAAKQKKENSKFFCDNS